MNSFNHNRTIFWILIFLVLVNISVLVGYFIVFRNAGNRPIPGITPGRGWALQKELSLTPEQALKVRNINTAYKAASEPLILHIRSAKSALLEELSRESTDTGIVSKLAEDIITEQKWLQKANVQQFLDLKKVCNPEQTKKLSQIYSELYGGSNWRNGNGRGNGKGMMRGHRWGQQRQADTITKDN